MNLTTTSWLLHRKLRIFAAVYDTTSTTAAAEMVGVTQSAVSKSIAQLESDLGVLLFERTLQGLHPMPTADVLRHRTRWIERELDIAGDELMNAGSLENTILSVGAGPVWNVNLLPKILPGFCRDNSKIRLDIVTGSGDYLVPRMIDGTLDIYFGVLYDDLEHASLQCERLLEMQLQVFVRENHPIFSQGVSLIESISDYPWIGFSSDNQLESNLERWCNSVGARMQKISLRLMSLATMMAVARASDHIIFVIDALNKELTNSGLVQLPILDGIGSVTSGLAVRSSIAELPPVKNLIRRARNLSRDPL